MWLTSPFHGTGHVFAVPISQRVVYIPWFQLGEPQLELTCNTLSSLSPCSPQSLPTPLETSPESQVINSNSFMIYAIKLAASSEPWDGKKVSKYIPDQTAVF